MPIVVFMAEPHKQRYVYLQILTIVSLMILYINEWRSQDLEGNEIQSQGGSILRS